MITRSQTTELPETKRKLVDAGIQLMRSKGFNATSVDDVCLGAGVTKGAFFHYFKSKEDLAKAVVERFTESHARTFSEAPFQKLSDPLARVYGRLDYAKEYTGGPAHTTKGCLIGLFAQELSFTHPELRQACQAAMSRIAHRFEQDLAEAKTRYAPLAAFEPKNVAQLYVAVLQGSQLMAKAADSNAVLMANLDQFRHYLQILFGQPQPATTAGPLN